LKVRYLVGTAPTPLPSLGGSRQRPRPLHPVRITGATHSLLRDSLLDTGSDDTVFFEGVASAIGVDLTHAPQRTILLAGRGPFSCRYAQALLRITDGASETYEWTAMVGFVPIRLQYPLLGQAGFFQFFDVDFHGADREAIVTPSWAFTGRRI
jgi:hypothetical protein